MFVHDDVLSSPAAISEAQIAADSSVQTRLHFVHVRGRSPAEFETAGKHNTLAPTLVLGDAIGLASAYAMALLLTAGDTSMLVQTRTAFGIGFVCAGVIMFARHGHYRPAWQLSALDTVPGVARVLVVVGLPLVAVAEIVDGSARAVDVGVIAICIAIVGVPIMRAIVFAFERRRRRHKTFLNVLILGMGDIAAEVSDRIRARPELGLSVVGFADSRPPPPDGRVSKLDGRSSQASLDSIIATLSVDHVIVAFSASKDASILDVLRRLDRRIGISVVPRLFDLTTAAHGFTDISRFPLMTLTRRPCCRAMAVAKRAMDVCVSLLLIIICLPVMAAIAVAIKVDDGGPVFFAQIRVGRDGERFRFYKFRTMISGAETLVDRLRDQNDADGVLFKVHADPRVTPVGHFLRHHSLDELPQLFNVLAGQMSLVGPRPALPDEVDAYPWWFAKRHAVRPGLTGMWQVSGRSDLDFCEATKLDMCYVEHWSLWLDITIMLRTLGVVARGDGGY